MGTGTSRRVRLGEVLVDLDDGTVQRGAERANLTPRQLHLLDVLVDSAPRVVTKDQLLAQVWAERVVAEAALSQCIMELRKVLGDDARRARFIETVARRGYRLVAPVDWLLEAASAGTVGSVALIGPSETGGLAEGAKPSQGSPTSQPASSEAAPLGRAEQRPYGLLDLRLGQRPRAARSRLRRFPGRVPGGVDERG